MAKKDPGCISIRCREVLDRIERFRIENDYATSAGATAAMVRIAWDASRPKLPKNKRQAEAIEGVACIHTNDGEDYPVSIELESGWRTVHGLAVGVGKTITEAIRDTFPIEKA